MPTFQTPVPSFRLQAEEVPRTSVPSMEATQPFLVIRVARSRGPGSQADESDVVEPLGREAWQKGHSLEAEPSRAKALGLFFRLLTVKLLCLEAMARSFTCS